MIEFRERPQKGLTGQPSDSSPFNDISRSANDVVQFGALVVFDDTDTQLCKSPAKKEDLDKPLGIAIRQKQGQNYPPKTPIRIRRQGRVFIRAKDVQAAGDAVYVSLDDKGAVFSGKKDGNLRLLNAIFLEPCSDGLAEIEIDFMGVSNVK